MSYLAGVIVVTHGALMGCPVLATNTPATRQYSPPESRDLLVPRWVMRAAMAERIERLWDDPDARRVAAERLHDYVVASSQP